MSQWENFLFHIDDENFAIGKHKKSSHAHMQTLKAHGAFSFQARRAQWKKIFSGSSRRVSVFEWRAVRDEARTAKHTKRRKNFKRGEKKKRNFLNLRAKN